MIIEIDGEKFNTSDFGYVFLYLSDADKKNIMNMPKENHCYGIFNDELYSTKEAKQMIKKFSKDCEKRFIF